MSVPKEVTERITEKQTNKTVSHVTNLTSEINNPCVKEHQLSHKCLNDNNYDRDACQLYFVNYQNCKDFWYQIQSERRRNGVKPYLPAPEDRAALKEGYLKANSIK